MAGAFKFLERVYGLALQAQFDDVPLGYARKASGVSAGVWTGACRIEEVDEDVRRAANHRPGVVDGVVLIFVRGVLTRFLAAFALVRRCLGDAFAGDFIGSRHVVPQVHIALYIRSVGPEYGRSADGVGEHGVMVLGVVEVVGKLACCCLEFAFARA